jgi:hypothetical protein
MVASGHLRGYKVGKRMIIAKFFIRKFKQAHLIGAAKITSGFSALFPIS